MLAHIQDMYDTYFATNKFKEILSFYLLLEFVYKFYDKIIWILGFEYQLWEV